MKQLPDDVSAYSRTPEFTRATLPKGLLRCHRTAEGTWGKIVVVEGRLRYRILEPTVEEVELTPDQCGVVEPTIPHEVEPNGHVRFFVEFYK